MRRPLVEFNVSSDQLEQMFAPSNVLTTESWRRRWLDNVVENLNMHPEPKPMRELMTQINRHISWVIGAGPSIRRLKRYGKDFDPSWGYVVTDHGLLQTLESGLKPTLVVTMDGHQETESAILDGFDLLAQVSPETPVLVDLVCCPSVVEKIKNPYFFRGVGNEESQLTKYIKQQVPKIDMMGHGGNVGSVCLVMAKFFCFSRHVGIIGLDSAMQEGTKRVGYYHGYVMPENHQYIDVSDIYGRPIVSMANLHNYKWWADHFCFYNDDVEWVNANDGGFLGVCNGNQNYDHFKYLTLPQAIAYFKEHGEED